MNVQCRSISNLNEHNPETVLKHNQYVRLVKWAHFWHIV